MQDVLSGTLSDTKILIFRHKNPLLNKTMQSRFVYRSFLLPTSW